MAKSTKLTLRGDIWHIVRRVPKRFESVASQTRQIGISLETDSYQLAQHKAPGVWQAKLDEWQARLDGRSEDARAAYEAVRKIAQGRGFHYIPVTEVAKLPDEDLLARFESIGHVKGVPNQEDAAALLGTVENPPLQMSEVYAEFHKLTANRRLGMSRDQIRKWENPFKRALNRWIDVNGDGPLTALKREDFLAFRAYWIERIELEGLTPNTANKDFDKLTNALNTVLDGLGLDFTLPIPKRNWRLAKADSISPPPFSSEWIRDKLLRPGALDGLNAEARAIFLICMNTGARPSEIATLLPERIKLDSNTPYIEIRPDGRVVKTKRAKRDIPLVGVALEAARAFPDGFPRYRDNPSSLSAAQLKYLRHNDLMESEDHVIYSLRHAFEDRMLKASFPERVKADLMGHDIDRERYGRGLPVEDMAVLLADISF